MTDFKAITSSLEERGFCVVPEFLSREEIDFLLADFEHVGRVVGEGAGYRRGGKAAFAKMCPRMEAFAQGITGAKAALYQMQYFQTPGISHPFHQDHDQFFLTEYNRTNLNSWIPLVKPSRTELGIHLIPFDRLAEESPRLFNLCRRSGASRLLSLRGGGIFYISDWSGVTWIEEGLEVEEVMETPEVGPGDMLLLRFNVIHATQSKDRKWIHPIEALPMPAATQTSEDRRIAVALRTCDPETPIDWHRVAASHTPVKIHDLVESKGLNVTAFRHNRENDFGTTLGDILPTLTGERE